MNRIDMKAHPFEFLWVELTNRCNLNCVHCYAASSPNGEDARLSDDDYMALIIEAAGLGCRRIQFIGGEPTLHPKLSQFISHARECGMEFVEVYTNARRIPESLIECFVRHQVNVAVSFYSDNELVHDSITRVDGSQRATLVNLRRFVQAKLSVRVGIVEMPENEKTIDSTMRLIHDLGIADYGTDRARKFGRAGEGGTRECSNMNELCGACWSIREFRLPPPLPNLRALSVP